jgi:hypothetical protein
MDKQASHPRQAGDKRMAQAARGIVIGWIGKQQVAGHGRLKKAIEASKRRLIVAGATGSRRCWASRRIMNGRLRSWNS